VASKVERKLRRRGFVPKGEDAEVSEDLGARETAVDACVRAALHTGTFERLDGQEPTKAANAQEEDARFDHRKRSPWAAEIDGFSVHAGVHIRAGDARGREILLRYSARPAFSLEWLSVLCDGRIAYRIKYPGRSGKPQRVMTPLEFSARLSALIPPPRRPAFRYHGAFAPAADWRKLVVPSSSSTTPAPEDERQDRCRPQDHPARPALRSERDLNVLARPTRDATTSTQAQAGGEAPASSVGAQDQARATHPDRRSTSDIDWPSLMLRTYAIDVLECPTCDSRMMLIGAITERDLAERILTHRPKSSAMVTPSRATSPASPSSTPSSCRTKDNGNASHRQTRRGPPSTAASGPRTCSR